MTELEVAIRGSVSSPMRDVGDAPSPTAAPRAAALALRRALDDWRAAERDLFALEMGSPDRGHLQAEVDTLRATHHRLFIEVSLPNRYKAVDSALG